jgi:predicted negative regulator of RcsB-dependent stress response
VEVYRTEEEQVEAIKKWWRENKWSLVGGIVIGVGALWGSRLWLDNRDAFTAAASAEYQMMLQQVSGDQTEQAAEQAAQLLGQYADTPYAALAALVLAKIKLEEGDAVAASSHLRWTLDNAEQETVRHEARLRLARLLLAQDKGGEALTLLNAVDAGAYEADYQQLKGDIQLAVGQSGAARTAYTRALAVLAPTAPSRQLLQVKLDDLGETEY